MRKTNNWRKCTKTEWLSERLRAIHRENASQYLDLSKGLYSAQKQDPDCKNAVHLGVRPERDAMAYLDTQFQCDTAATKDRAQRDGLSCLKSKTRANMKQEQTMAISNQSTYPKLI